MEITINTCSVTRATSESIYPIACTKIRHNDTFYQIILHGIWRFKRTVYKCTCLIHRHSLIRYTYIKMRENLFISICFAFQIYYWDPINRFNPVYFCSCPKSGPEFSTSYVIVIFICAQWEGVWAHTFKLTPLLFIKCK